MPSSSRHHRGGGQGGGGAADASSSSLVYDPAQDLAEKRALRKDYRSLIAKTDEARANLGEHDAVDLRKYIEDGEGLRGRLKGPNEGILDSRLLLNISDMGAQLAKNMKLNANAFDVDEYIGRVARFIGGSATAGSTMSGRRSTQRTQTQSGRRRSRGHVSDDDDDEDDADDIEDYDSWNWHRLGSIASRFSRRAPTMDHLLGPLAVEARTRSAAQIAAAEAAAGKRRRLLERAEEEEAPQQLQQGDLEANEGETSKLVRDISKRLRDIGGQDGCNLFEFAIDPESFSNTVENLFYVSFLIKEGKAAIDKEDEPGGPILLDCMPPSEEDYASGLRKRQVVLELDFATYRGLIEAYGIKKSIIPHRKAGAGAAARKGKWYG